MRIMRRIAAHILISLVIQTFVAFCMAFCVVAFYGLTIYCDMTRACNSTGTEEDRRFLEDRIARVLAMKNQCKAPPSPLGPGHGE